MSEVTGYAQSSYLRYHSRLRPPGTSRPISLPIIDVEGMKLHEMIVAVRSPVRHKRYMFLHVDRKTQEVKYFPPRILPTFDNLKKAVPVGIHAEVVTF